MSTGKTRNLWGVVFTNFINSLRPRQLSGNNMGKDYLGNIYYEIPPDPSAGKRKATRWYDPPSGRDFQSEIPAEWEAWLRMRRVQPPTEQEIAENLAIAQMKKENANKLEQKRLAEGGALPSIPSRGPETYPVYPDLPVGDPENEFRNK